MKTDYPDTGKLREIAAGMREMKRPSFSFEEGMALIEAAADYIDAAADLPLVWRGRALFFRKLEVGYVFPMSGNDLDGTWIGHDYITGKRQTYPEAVRTFTEAKAALTDHIRTALAGVRWSGPSPAEIVDQLADATTLPERRMAIRFVAEHLRKTFPGTAPDERERKELKRFADTADAVLAHFPKGESE